MYIRCINEIKKILLVMSSQYNSQYDTYKMCVIMSGTTGSLI